MCSKPKLELMVAKFQWICFGFWSWINKSSRGAHTQLYILFCKVVNEFLKKLVNYVA
jgi:hypothetical protein